MKQKFENDYATEIEQLQNQDCRNLLLGFFLEILGRWFRLKKLWVIK